LVLSDLFFLVCFVMGIGKANHPFVVARCHDVQDGPATNTLDVWARGHYKSAIITQADTLRYHLNNPEKCTGILAYARTAAKPFLRSIKVLCENSDLLKRCFPDILWENPQSQAPKWSEDDGLVFRRKSNPKESSLEAWGLVDGQPTSRHYSTQIFDDVVAPASVTTPDMVAKTNEAWEMSLNLGSIETRRRYIGTRYHANDLYGEIMKRGSAKPRIYAATDTGRADGLPIFMTAERWANVRRDVGAYTLACQYLQNPKQDGAMGFKAEWLRWYPVGAHPPRAGMNVYIVVDGAKGFKTKNDYTVMTVWGFAADGNKYLLDAFRGRVNLGDRAARLFGLVHKWRPSAVGYEEDSAQADLDFMNLEMKRLNWRFNIIPIPTHGVSKIPRILRLQPDFQNGRIWLPERLLFQDHQGETRDFVADLRFEEYDMFPVCKHDDMLDCCANIYAPELGAVFPAYRGPGDVPDGRTNNAWKPF
jgi:phage terminase large subunit-like protein